MLRECRNCQEPTGPTIYGDEQTGEECPRCGSTDTIPAGESKEALCGCSECGCSEEATEVDQGSGISLCDACADYTLGPDGEVICSAMTEGGATCHECGETIEWGSIHTGQPGNPNIRFGDCNCAAHHWEQRDEGGTWRAYYVVEIGGETFEIGFEEASR